MPKDKQEVVAVLQKRGMVVGMTGDGVNDAPALKQVSVCPRWSGWAGLGGWLHAWVRTGAWAGRGLDRQWQLWASGTTDWYASHLNSTNGHD